MLATGDWFLAGEGMSVVHGVVIGVGATLVMDLWALFLQRVVGIPSLSFCLVGRWLRHMPAGTFTHAKISAATQMRGECAVGWIAHYLIGVVFALMFLLVVSTGWLSQPTLLPAVLFGVATVVFPFFIMQPSFGFGIAASKTPDPTRARLKSLMTHAVFGLGLYGCAVGFQWSQ